MGDFSVYLEVFGFVYPLTIIASRYGGRYEGGKYVAFQEFPEGIADAHGSDIACADFFRYYPRPIGRGSTPDAAYRDLCHQLGVEE